MILKQSATFEKWRGNLRDRNAKAAIAIRLQRLANGYFGDVAPIGDGLSELRIHLGPGYRIYLRQQGETVVLLLCGGDKSSQDRDIKRAKSIAAEWSDNNG
ncbi:MAG: type II toxin-antitoxin system RelE/ParE family toxin [Rhizobiaceae bacterium]